MSFKLMKKILVSVRVFKNWYMVPLDRLRVVKFVDYKIRSGAIMRCRGGSTDSGTVAVIFSGYEYPPNSIKPCSFPENPSVWDLGANIGAFSVWVSRQLKGGNFLCVEPDEGNISMLKHNFSLNGLGNVEIIQGVVGAEDGMIRVDYERAKDAICITNNETGTLTPQYKLESLAKKYGVKRIHLLKVDIEGAECSVLQSAASFINEHVDKMIVEIHGLVKGLAHPLANDFKENFNVTLIHDNVLCFVSKKLSF